MNSSQQLERIYQYFPDLTNRQKQQFSELYPLYREWNEKINVISRKDIENIYSHHVLHSLAIAKVIYFLPGARILDIGTGGGFPGIPLAILFPEISFHLVDSIGKKINVVRAVADTLQLENISSEHLRAEKVKGQYDFIVTRAVARLRLLWDWGRKKISSDSKHDLPNGLLGLKGGDLTQELEEVDNPHRTYSLSEYFQEDFFETKKIIYLPGTH